MAIIGNIPYFQTNPHVRWYPQSPMGASRHWSHCFKAAWHRARLLQSRWFWGVSLEVQWLRHWYDEISRKTYKKHQETRAFNTKIYQDIPSMGVSWKCPTKNPVIGSGRSEDGDLWWFNHQTWEFTNKKRDWTSTGIDGTKFSGVHQDQQITKVKIEAREIEAIYIINIWVCLKIVYP